MTDSNENPSIPIDEGVNSFETPLFKMHFSRDGKVILISRDPSIDFHITLHPGGKSGYLDIHKKIERPGEAPTYETLYKISHQELSAKLEIFANRLMPRFLPELTKLYRPITFGWLHHRGYGLAAGRYPKVSQLRKAGAGGGKRLNVTPEVMGRLLSEPEYLEDILDLEDTTFAIIKTRHGQSRTVGLLYKKLRDDGNYSLFWIKQKDFNRFIRFFENEMRQVFSELGLELPESDLA